MRLPTRMDPIGSVVISGFPIGTRVSYVNAMGVSTMTTIGAVSDEITITGADEAMVESRLDSVTVTAPAESDVNFALNVKVMAATANANIIAVVVFQVTVLAVADKPTLSVTSPIMVIEDLTVPLVITAGQSADQDDSETLTVQIQVAMDAMLPIGTIIPPSGLFSGITFDTSASATGLYVITPTKPTAAGRDADLDAYLAAGVSFQPRAHLSGDFGANAITVEAISTETNPTREGGSGLADANSAAHGTVADSDTAKEICVAFIAVTISPVADIPTLLTVKSSVNENNGNSAMDDPLVVDIGNRINLMFHDVDGSESVFLQIDGFPINSMALGFSTAPINVMDSTPVAGSTTVTLSGKVVAVKMALSTLMLTLKHDDAKNVVLTISGTVTDDAVSFTSHTATFNLTYTLCVLAVADNPIATLGFISPVPPVEENTGFAPYPVIIRLDDDDFSEEYLNVMVTASTPPGTTGALPDIQFPMTPGLTVSAPTNTATTTTVTVTALSGILEPALLALEIRPGNRNGEDITVNVTVTSVEINDLVEPNLPGGQGFVGSEIFIPTASSVVSFAIPVDPVPSMPSLVLPTTMLNEQGCEDLEPMFLGDFGVMLTDPDNDGSESFFVEFETTNLPMGFSFVSASGTPVGVVTGLNIVRVNSTKIPDVQGIFLALPEHYSGAFVLQARAVLIDATLSGSKVETSAFMAYPIKVKPKADNVTKPLPMVVIEDKDTDKIEVAFGSYLNGNFSVIDNGTGMGNNAGVTETIKQVVLRIPANTTELTYNVTGPYAATGPGAGAAQVVFDLMALTYNITHPLLAGPLQDVSTTNRTTAEADIRATLATFSLTLGPQHTDENAQIFVVVSTLDVNEAMTPKEFDCNDDSFTLTIRVQAVADVPAITVMVDSLPPKLYEDDTTGVLLTITATNSMDMDGSETTSVEIEVPSDSSGVQGTIASNVLAHPNIALLVSGGVYRFTPTGVTSVAKQTALNDFLTTGAITFKPRKNLSGKINLIVRAISTEDELATDEYSVKTAMAAGNVEVTFCPIADEPEVKGNAIGLEDDTIYIPLSVSLADLDGSETYTIVVTGVVPSNAILYGADKLIPLTPNGDNHFVVMDVTQLYIKPPLHWSSAGQSDMVLTLRTTVTDTEPGGVTDVRNFTNTISVDVTGVADKPGTKSINVTGIEDVPIALGSFFGDLSNVLVDKDNSESLSFVLSGLPTGIIPSSTGGTIINRGGGSYQIPVLAVANLVIPAIPNYSGAMPYPAMRVVAVSQELDGDQAESDPWTFTFEVEPVADNAIWDPIHNQDEDSGDIPLIIARDQLTIVDTATEFSEVVDFFTFDLRTLLTDAEIGMRFTNVTGAIPNVANLINNLPNQGTFTNNGNGTITVLPSNLANVYFPQAWFLNSNVKFSIRAYALIRVR
jgi:hypothetical protein